MCVTGEKAEEERSEAEVHDVEPVGAQQERDQREGGGEGKNVQQTKVKISKFFPPVEIETISLKGFSAPS